MGRMIKRREMILIALLILSLFDDSSLASAQSSPNDILKTTVLSGGGDYSSSTHYGLISTIGQPSAIGLSSSDNYVNHAGFWYTVGLRQMLFLPLILRQ
jgi:hypothetical protein